MEIFTVNFDGKFTN